MKRNSDLNQWKYESGYLTCYQSVNTTLAFNLFTLTFENQ